MDGAALTRTSSDCTQRGGWTSPAWEGSGVSGVSSVSIKVMPAMKVDDCIFTPEKVTNKPDSAAVGAGIDPIFADLGFGVF
jgi:uncharacterized Zn-binding protein involved in type VI secretion